MTYQKDVAATYRLMGLIGKLLRKQRLAKVRSGDVDARSRPRSNLGHSFVESIPRSKKNIISRLSRTTTPGVEQGRFSLRRKNADQHPITRDTGIQGWGEERIHGLFPAVTASCSPAETDDNLGRLFVDCGSPYRHGSLNKFPSWRLATDGERDKSCSRRRRGSP